MTRNTTTATDTHRELIHNGWEQLNIHALNDGGIGRNYYRFDGSDRHELHLLYDTAGRLRAWSHWVNVRHDIDQEPGLRDRLHDFIRENE